MIIECINCNKKFNVDSELIPLGGRYIQCGSCNHTWFYKIETSNTKSNFLNIQQKQKISIITKKRENPNNENLTKDRSSIIFKQEFDTKENTNKRYEFKYIGNFLSYIIVFVISFVALLILIDTFRFTLINIFPQLDTILFNLFEILKDIKLFIIDLT